MEGGWLREKDGRRKGLFGEEIPTGESEPYADYWGRGRGGPGKKADGNSCR